MVKLRVLELSQTKPVTREEYDNIVVEVLEEVNAFDSAAIPQTLLLLDKNLRVAFGEEFKSIYRKIKYSIDNQHKSDKNKKMES